MKNLLSERSKELLERENCFDFVRYFFTISVFIVHFFDLTDSNLSWFISGTESVRAFFIISGFLIFYSHIQKNNIKYYIQKRIRRILPPYIAVILLFTLVGVFLSKLIFFEYIISTTTYKYLIANLSFLNFIQPTLPGVFESNPIEAINGSLWTMKVEIMFYISVPFILPLLKKYNKLFIILGILAFATIYEYIFTFLYEQTNNELYLLIRKQIGSQFMYFYSGTFILLYFDYFIKYLKYIVPLAIILYIFSSANIIFSLLAPLTFSTIVIGIAYLFRFMNFMRKYDNISYGMYLYHYPIIQLFIYYKIINYNVYLGFLGALATTIFVSILSWKFIEKPIIEGRLFKR